MEIVLRLFGPQRQTSVTGQLVRAVDSNEYVPPRTHREAESTTLRRHLRLLWKALCGLLCLGTAVSAAVTVVAAVELRRHLGRSFLSLPLSVHLLLDALLALAPLLAAEGDGEGEPPPPVPTSQVRPRSSIGIFFFCFLVFLRVCLRSSSFYVRTRSG